VVTSRADLEELGFVGFVPFGDLPTSEVPREHGVYVVLRPVEAPPVFRAVSSAGRPAGRREPSVDVDILRRAWVEGEEIIYIGKAGGRGGLRSRLSAYRRHGAGLPVKHWGGRYVWQLDDSDTLLVAWRTTPEDDPRNVEAMMLTEFQDRTGSLPFANLQQGRSIR